MEIFGMLFGGCFFTVILAAWILLWRVKKWSRRRLVIGLAVIIVFPVICALSMAKWILIDEPLYAAASDGNTAKVSSLLAWRGNPNAEFEGSFALEAAAREGHTDVVRLLLDHGADVNVKGAVTGNTPLMSAQEGGHSEIVRLLKKAGAKK